MNDPKKEKVLSEKETRAKFLRLAFEHYGPEGRRQLQMHFDKFDNLLKNCKNEEERKHIAHLGCIEFYKMMGFHDGLSLDYKHVIDGEPIEMPDAKGWASPGKLN